MSRFNLPDISFLDSDVGEIEENLVSKFEELRGVTLSEKDPRRSFLKSIAYALTLERNNIDYSLKQTYLSYAEDDFLDQYGEKRNIPRLEPTAARTIFEAEVETIEINVIPKGTRVSVGDLFFEITEDTPIDENITTIQVPGKCLEIGTIGNGFFPGQINQLVDPLPWIKSIKNVITSSGGLDWEDDDSYAERIRLAKETLSTAGPSEAYRFFAKSADQQIGDVDIDSPEPGSINIIVLLKNGMVPDSELLDKVVKACSDKTVRPLTDQVTASSADIVPYDIDLTYYIKAENQLLTDSIQQQVSAAVEEYKQWQGGKLGRNIEATELIGMLKQAGTGRIELREPVMYKSLSKREVAVAMNVNIVYGGVEDE